MSKSNLDLDRFRLRRFIESLTASDEVDIHDEHCEFADLASIMQANPKAVWFRNVGADKQELVGNVVGSRSRLAPAFGVEPRQVALEMQGTFGHAGGARGECDEGNIVLRSVHRCERLVVACHGSL